jgi:hypothetical protein
VRTGIDLVLFVVWASVGLVALGVWFIATLRLSRRRVPKPTPARARTTPVSAATAKAPNATGVTATV